ncbi:MAG: Hsp20/alpha crystallin family protein [Reichenbachiella sp.]|uniref:Hsp20/alpha crystallin family protein n=1 Tax=Reichenbachiella sp. TaxID=2184521 RepID=UPI003264FD6F
MSLLVKRGDTLPSSFGNFFDDLFKDDFLPSYIGNAVPAVNVSEEKDQFKIEVAAPGMEKGDFKLNLDHNVLTISCEKKKEDEMKDKKYTRREFSYTSFRRSFTLPESVNGDKIDAGYNDGILKIKLPKKTEAQKVAAKEIKIA